MTLVVILTVRRDQVSAFRAFETQAAIAMAKYGGAIARTVAITPEPDAEAFKEVHIVTFPDARAFEAYRGDAELAAWKHLREASVVDTQVMIGEDGPDYGGGSASSSRLASARR
jgi:hypothetical protein